MKTIKFYQLISLVLYVLFASTFLMSCAVHKIAITPRPSEYEQIENVEVDNGYPKQRQPWIAYSDRDKNRVNPSDKEEYGDVGSSPYKEVGFLYPLIILRHKGTMYETADYSPDLLNGNARLPKKAPIKIYGWIPEDRLLLWNNCLKSSETGFTVKAALVVNGADVLRNTGKYIENDSIIVFNSPDLLNKTTTKLAMGRMVYIYKLSNDKTRYLVGDLPNVMPDSVKDHIFGWVSSNVIALWGERAAIRLNETDSPVQSDIFFAHTNTDSSLVANDSPVIQSDNLLFHDGFDNMFPFQVSDTSFVSQGRAVKYFTNAFDYDANKIYNVLGNPIYYLR